MVSPSSQWRYAHNYCHHVFSNVIGMDDDLGFGVIRVSRDQEWKPGYLWAPLRGWAVDRLRAGIALHNLAAEQRDQATEEAKSELKRAMFRKMGRQAAKDYLFYPALSGLSLSADLPGESGRRRFPQRVGVHRHRVWTLRRWR